MTRSQKPASTSARPSTIGAWADELPEDGEEGLGFDKLSALLGGDALETAAELGRKASPVRPPRADGRREATLTLERIGCLLTMDPALGAGPLGELRDAAIAMDGDQIVWVGPQSQLASAVVLEDDSDELAGPERLDIGDRLVTPGWIDCHTHLLFAGGREHELDLRIRGASYQEIAAAGGGIAYSMRQTRAASFDDLLDSGLHTLSQMLQLGITTCEVKSGYGLDLESELKLLEVAQTLEQSQPISIVSTFLGAHTIPPEHRANRSVYVDQVVNEMLPEVANRGLADFCDIFIESGAFTVEEGRRILTEARALGFKLKIHAEQLSHTGAAQLAAELGATSAEHLEYATDEDLRALRDAGVVAVLLPGAAFFIGQEFPDARRFLDAGVRVAVSTDFNPGTSPSFNLPLMGTIAGVRMKMPPPEILRAVTVNAAAAVGRAESIGQVRPGMKGDLAVFSVQDFRTLFYRFGANHCSMVIKDGQLAWP